MSGRGFFPVDRSVWGDPDFADEAFSEREAFLWLVSEAAWKPHRVRVGAAVVDLARGQCAFSTRFLAAKWRWSEPRVRRFLARLIKRNRIRSETDARSTRITICKYDVFQNEEASTDAPATHQRRKAEQSKQGNSIAALPAREREDLVSIEASCREAAGAVDNPAHPLKDLTPILAWLDAGFSLEEDILPVIRRKAPASLGSWAYFTKALQEALDASHKAVSAAQAAARNPVKRDKGGGRPQARDDEGFGRPWNDTAARYIARLQEQGEDEPQRAPFKTNDPYMKALLAMDDEGHLPLRRRPHFSDPITNAILRMDEDGSLEEMDRNFRGGPQSDTAGASGTEAEVYPFDAEANVYAPRRGTA